MMAALWWRDTNRVGEILDELEWPTLEARRDQSSLLFFHKIHCWYGTMSDNKDVSENKMYYTRSSHNSQYCISNTFI